MKQLIGILATFNRKEIKEFGTFLHSPIFNKDSVLRRFYAVLLPLYPKFKKIKQTAIFKQLYSEKMDYDAGLMATRITDLYKLAVEFLIFLEQRADQQHRTSSLMESALRRGLPTAFEVKLAKTNRRLANAAPKEVDYLFHRHRVEDLAFRQNTRYKNQHAKQNLYKTTRYLDAYYCLKKLRYAVATLSYQGTLDEDSFLLEELLAFLKKHPTPEIPLIGIYSQLLYYFKDEKQGNSPALRALVTRQSIHLSKYELQQVVLLIINYCHLKITEGNPTFKEETFFWYNFLLDEKALLVGRKNIPAHISPHHFYNIVRSGLEMNQTGQVPYTWTADFIRKYKSKIISRYRKTVYHYCMALFHFAQGDFSQTYDFLVKIKHDEVVIDFYYTIYYQTLLIQTAYELDEWNLLDASLKSLRHFLGRNKRIAPALQKGYENFRKLTKKLFNKKIGKRLIFEDLVEKIGEFSPLLERGWLVEKARELEI